MSDQQDTYLSASTAALTREWQLRPPPRPMPKMPAPEPKKTHFRSFGSALQNGCWHFRRRLCGNAYARFCTKAICATEGPSPYKIKLETTMLSPHEIATLVLLCGNSQPRDLDTVDVETLLALQLLTLERPSPGVSEPRVTLQGHALLKSLGVLRVRKGMQTAAALR